MCVFSGDFYFDSTLILTTLPVKQGMYIEVRHHVCGDSRFGSVNSHCWFALCWPYT
jgi:hypothetical protein